MSYGTVQAEKMTTESGYSLGAGNASSFKNRIINGGMTISQRNGTTGTLITADGQYGLDRFQYRTDQLSKLTSTQSTNAPTGFKNSNQTTVTTANSPSSSNYASLKQSIEGFNVYDFAFGTVNAKSVTISFWVYSSVTGTYGYRLTNSTASRSYVLQYTISSANTWTQVTASVPGDTSGTWLTDNGIGIAIQFDLGSGSSFETASPNTWVSTDSIRVSGNVQLINNASATWYVTGVQVEVGTVATSFDFRPYGTELALCQRYFQKSYEVQTAVGTATATNAIRWYPDATTNYASVTSMMLVEMRTTATYVLYSTTGASGQIRNLDAGTNLSGYANGSNTNSFQFSVNNTSVGQSTTLGVHFTASAEL